MGGLRFPRFRFARQFNSDIRTLFGRHVRGNTCFGDRARALDRIAGSLFLLCVALSAVWLASQTLLPKRLDVPTVTETAQAASDALDPEIQKRVVEAAAEPMTPDEIRKLQTWLAMIGFDPGLVDGRVGPRTLGAFNQYRASQNLSPVSRIDRANAADLLD